MEPVSTAIIAGLVNGITKVGEKTFVTAYEALKTALCKKCGSNSYVIQAVEHLEKKPDDKIRQTGVAEEIKAAKANEDAELITAAETLLAELKKTPTGQQAVAGIDVKAKHIGVVGDNVHVEGNVIGHASYAPKNS